MAERADARRLLAEQHADLAVVFADGTTQVVKGVGGILPLLRCRDEEGARFCGASFADKIVGKAAAMLYVRLQAGEVYGEVMTATARDILTAHGIRATWGTLTDKIINRAGTGICPMERAVAEISDPAAAEAALRAAVGPY